MKKVCLVLAAFMVLVFLANEAISAPPVKLGFNDIRSGPFKNNGDMALLGLETAAKEINKAGGLLGRQIQFVIEDNQGNPEIAVQKLKKMILEDKVEAVFHESFTAVGLAIAQTMPRYKKLYIAQGVASIAFTGENYNPYVFHTTANVVQYVKGHMTYFVKDKKYKKIYLINFDNVYGHDVAKYCEVFLKQVAPDVQIVGNEFHPVFTKDFAPYITKIKASGADYIFTGDWGTDLIQIVKQGRTMGLNVPIAGILLGDANLLPVIGDSVKGGVVATFQLLGTNMPKAVQFEEAFYKEAKTWPVEQIYQGWSALMMYADAVKKAGSFDTEKVIKAWEGLEWDGPYGKVLMRAKDHQALLPLFVGKVEGKTKYFDYPYFTYLMTVTREQLEYKPEDYGWKPYKGR
jgi:branched-chain amino acid transport system substrate-binding protein